MLFRTGARILGFLSGELSDRTNKTRSASARFPQHRSIDDFSALKSKRVGGFPVILNPRRIVLFFFFRPPVARALDPYARTRARKRDTSPRRSPASIREFGLTHPVLIDEEDAFNPRSEDL